MNSEQEYNPRRYWERRLNEHFSLQGVGNLSFGYEYNIWLYRLSCAVIKRTLSRWRIKVDSRSVLDIGVGTGYFIDFWTGLGAGRITGIDITSKSVCELSRRYPDFEFFEADISGESIPFDGQYDIITAFDVLHHIVDEEDFRSAIGNIARLCNDQTVILIKDSFLKDQAPPGVHEYYRTLNKYIEILAEHGLVITTMVPAAFFMVPTTDAARIHNGPARKLMKLFPRANIYMLGAFRRLGAVGRCLRYMWGGFLCVLDRIILRFTSVAPSQKLALVRKQAPDR